MPGHKVEDNMSIAMLIARKYKQNIKINTLRTPEDAANIVIKDTKHFDVNAE